MEESETGSMAREGTDAKKKRVEYRVALEDTNMIQNTAEGMLVLWGTDMLRNIELEDKDIVQD